MVADSKHASGVVELTAKRFEAKLPKLIADVAREEGLARVVTRIATSVVTELGVRTAGVHLMSRSGRELRLVAARNADTVAQARFDVQSDRHPAAQAARTGLLQLADAEEDGDGEGVTFAIPLFACSRTIGVVSATTRALAPKDCEVLGALSDPLGALVEREQLREEVARAREAARQRVQRIARVAHDMRQPLNVMMFAGAFLAIRSDGVEKSMLERVRASGRLLDRMIGDLSDTSFLDGGRVAMTRAPTDIAALVSAAVARHSPDAEVSAARGLPKVDVDPQRIEQVLMNLLVNAKKHGGSTEKTRVDVARRGEQVLVSVTNDGEGIRDEERSKIFDAYYQARGQDGRGLGLGLHICKSLVEQHGGRIWAESDGTGSCFHFTLPVAPRAAGEDGRPTSWAH